MSRHRWQKYSLTGPTLILAGLLVSLGSGCHWHGGYGAGGCGPCGAPIADSCGSGCGESCASFPATCGSCGPSGCGFSGLVLPLLHPHPNCVGCGDVYWGEWISNPPECCDACNEGGCWAGSGVDGSYGAYDNCGYGYGPGYGCGLLAGPVAVIRGAYLGATHVVGGALSLFQCGYRSACGPYGYSYGDACGGCGQCGSCNSCGEGAPVGDVPSDMYITSRPTTGSGVRTARAERQNPRRPAVQPAQRIATQRLRR